MHFDRPGDPAFFDESVPIMLRFSKYAAPGGRQKPGHGDASNWITTSGGCIRAGSQSDRAEHGLNKIVDIVSVRSFVICSSQREHFGVDDIRHCC